MTGLSEMTQSDPLSANETSQILGHHDIARKHIDGVVQFLLIGCQTDVPNTDVGGKSDPYAVIESSGFSTKTLIKMDTLRPQWCVQTLFLELEYLSSQQPHHLNV